MLREWPDRATCWQSLLILGNMLQNSLLLDELDQFVKYLVETRRPQLYFLDGNGHLVVS